MWKIVGALEASVLSILYIYIYIYNQNFWSSHIFTHQHYLKIIKKKKKTKTLNTVTISNPITISPQNKPNKIYSL